MDFVLEKIDYYIEELKKFKIKDTIYIANKEKEEYSLCDVDLEIRNLIRLHIYNFIQYSDTLKHLYNIRVNYFYKIIQLRDYLEPETKLKSMIFNIYKSIDKDEVEKYFPSEKIHNCLYDLFPHICFYEDKITISKLLDIITCEENYLKFNPDEENIERVLNQFSPENVFRILFILEHLTKIPIHKIFIKNGFFDNVHDKSEDELSNILILVRQVYSEEFFKLQKLLIDIPELGNLEYFSLFDKYSYLYNQTYKLDNCSKFKNYEKMLKQRLTKNGIVANTIKMLQLMRIDYIELKQNPTLFKNRNFEKELEITPKVNVPDEKYSVKLFQDSYQLKIDNKYIQFSDTEFQYVKEFFAAEFNTIYYQDIKSKFKPNYTDYVSRINKKIKKTMPKTPKFIENIPRKGYKISSCFKISIDRKR